MKDKDLMQPRYKVIADYPNSVHGIGDILYASEWNGVYTSAINGQEVMLPSEYPAIFKKLEWWEERTAEEMPEYVKLWNSNRCCRVVEIIGTNPFGQLVFRNEDSDHYSFPGFVPATKEEYETQSRD